MIGYHYTSWNNWKSIQIAGLVPYPIKMAGLLDYFDSVSGVLVWRRRLTGAPHVGSVLFQATTKCTTRVVLLRVRYKHADLLRWEGKRRVVLFHKGHIGSWQYHDGSQTAVVIATRVPVADIHLIAVYDLEQLFGRRQYIRCA